MSPPPQDVGDQALLGSAQPSGAASRSTATDNAVCASGAVSAWVASDQACNWNGSTWNSAMTDMPADRQMGGGRGNYDDFMFAGGDTGGTNNPSKDTFLWTGTWASASYPQMVEYHSEGYALGGNTQSAFAHSGSDGYTSIPYQKQYSEVWSGTAWAASVTSSYGGQGTCGDGLPDDFFGGGGYNSQVTPTDVANMESFNGTAWANQVDFPYPSLTAWHLYGSGMFCCSGVDSAFTMGNSTDLDDNAVTYDGSAWAAAGDMTVSIRGGSYGGDSTFAIGGGYYPAATNSMTYDGSFDGFTTVGNLATAISHGSVGGNS